MDKLSPGVIIHLENLRGLCFYVPAMVAHTEPVRSWGHKPCGSEMLSTTTCVSGGWRRAAPARDRARQPRGKTLRNCALEQAYGRRQIPAGVAERSATNEQRPSHAAASAAEAVALAPSHEGGHSDWPGGFVRQAFSVRRLMTSGIAVK